MSGLPAWQGGWGWEGSIEWQTLGLVAFGARNRGFVKFGLARASSCPLARSGRYCNEQIMGIPAKHPSSVIDQPAANGKGVRHGIGAGFSAGSMVALLLVLTVMPGAAALAAPEAMGHLSVMLHEVVRPKPDRDPREPRVSVSDSQSIERAVLSGPIESVPDNGHDVATCGRAPVVLAHRSRAEVFAARPWCMSTPPPAV